jgi:hypothetical protein
MKETLFFGSAGKRVKRYLPETFWISRHICSYGSPVLKKTPRSFRSYREPADPNPGTYWVQYRKHGTTEPVGIRKRGDREVVA